MKKIISIVVILLSFKLSNAQTIDEWFKQNNTQKKYLLQQIAAFKIYLGHVHKGYSIARKGLNTIGSIKEGDFNLHRDFFGSLKNVNSEISSYSKVADIIALQVKIISIYKSTHKYVQSKNLYTPSEVDFVFKTYTNLISSSTNDINELISVIIANELDMKDDERLERIDAIYNSIQDKYAFAQNFGDEAKMVAVQRNKEKNNIETSRRLYEIKN